MLRFDLNYIRKRGHRRKKLKCCKWRFNCLIDLSKNVLSMRDSTVLSEWCRDKNGRHSAEGIFKSMSSYENCMNLHYDMMKFHHYSYMSTPQLEIRGILNPTTNFDQRTCTYAIPLPLQCCTQYNAFVLVITYGGVEGPPHIFFDIMLSHTDDIITRP